MALVLQECVDLFEAGRQARQIQAQAPQQCDPVSLRRWSKLSLSRRARTKLSMAFLGQLAFTTFGSGGRFGGMYAQCFWIWTASLVGSSGHSAPCSIQARM